jgi:uncharacterized protein YaaR (DUF327 family)
MLKEFQNKYKNVTVAYIMIYLRSCKSCQKKREFHNAGSVFKFMVLKEINSRCKVDLIDMQS